MKNISAGFGLCAIAAAVALYPVLDRFAPIGKEAHAGVPVAAITASAMGQTAPTIVWYSQHTTADAGYQGVPVILFRAWSDGRVEMLQIEVDNWPTNGCLNDDLWECGNGWQTISDPNQGYSAASDANFDAKVDGTDLALLLTNWGDAPRHDIPPSDCPLNLINP